MPFGSMVEYHPVSSKDQSRGSINAARKFHLECSSDMYCMRVESKRRSFGVRH